MKRSVSPLSGQDPAPQPRKKRLISVFSALKGIFSRASPASDIPKPDSKPPPGTVAIQNEEADEIPTSFVSLKRKNSIHDSIKRSSLAIPRSSVSVPSGKSILESLYDSARSQREELDADGEFARLGSHPEDQLLREVSPSVHVPKTRVLPQNPSQDGALVKLDGLNTDLDDEHNQLVLNEGYPYPEEEDVNDWGRPSFINLDPRERYQILQMKKAMQASEYLESRLKYMVDPDETTSVIKPNNKVDSSTQTHTKEYLQNTLNFSKLQAKLARKNRRQMRTKKGLGAFSGDFYYEPSVVEPPSNKEQKLSGLLGTVNKPKFTVNVEYKPEKGLPDSDSRQSVNKRRGSFNQRPGLTFSLDKSRESLDDDYVKKLKSSSRPIQLKDQPLEAKARSVGPSSAFKFDIQKDKIASIFNQANQEANSADQSGEKVPEQAKPSFTFTAGPSSDKPTNETEKAGISSSGSVPKAPLFSFGSKAGTQGPQSSEKEGVSNATRKSMPLFSFAKPSPVEADSSAVTKSDASSTDATSSTVADSAKRTSSIFGDSTSSGKSNPISFSFGSATQPKNTEKADTENGEAKTSSAPPLSIFGQSKTGVSSPLFSYKAPEKAAEATNNKPSNGSKSLFSFGMNNKSDTAAPTVGITNEIKKPEEIIFTKPKETTETSAETGAQKPVIGSVETSAPKFSFGSTPGSTFVQKPSSQLPGVTSSAEPSDEAEESSRKRKVPAISSASIFGAPPVSSPSLTAGGEKAASEKNVFSFGAKKSPLAEEPAYKSDKAGNTTEGPTVGFGSLGGAPKFSFGNQQTGAKETPSFYFGGAKTSPSVASANASTTSTDKQPGSALPGASSLKPPAASSFQFGGASNPTTFGNPTSSSSEQTPAPAFPFANPNPPKASAGASGTFNFGQSSTADPASIFGAKTNAPAPAFNFSMAAKPASNPDQATPFGAAPKPAVGFSFGSTTAPAFGGSRPTTPANTGPAFGVGNQFGGTQAPGFGGFNTNTAPSSVFGDTSRSVTPNFGGFEQNTAGQPGNVQLQPNGFSFSSNAMGGFNSNQGSFGQTSREGTPPAFGNPMAGAGAAPPGANINGRKIAQMRQRKRR